MARKSKSTKAKGRNGEGDSLTVFFDQSDPAERRALEAARLLAAKHGRRNWHHPHAGGNHFEVTGHYGTHKAYEK
ncbi:MAG: hypothetical protein ABI970_08100 [Chloroflexota bacterium]